MFSAITNIYNLTATAHSHTRFNTLTRVWQQLEYRIDVCRVIRGALIEHL
jgi:hypothetical protein